MRRRARISLAFIAAGALAATASALEPRPGVRLRALDKVTGQATDISLKIGETTTFGRLSLTVRAFTIIVVGGVGNLAGAMIAGLMLGVAEAFTAFLWSPKGAPAISVILLLIILVVFPRGLASWRKA